MALVWPRLSCPMPAKAVQSGKLLPLSITLIYQCPSTQSVSATHSNSCINALSVPDTLTSLLPSRIGPGQLVLPFHPSEGGFALITLHTHFRHRSAKRIRYPGVFRFAPWAWHGRIIFLPKQLSQTV